MTSKAIRFALVRVSPDGVVLADWLMPFAVVAEVASILERASGMENQFKVCGNCGHCTMAGGEYVCIDPAKPQQEVVPMGARRPCFVVTPLTPEQLTASALSPVESATIN